jgi:hypothetical protein
MFSAVPPEGWERAYEAGRQKLLDLGMAPGDASRVAQGFVDFERFSDVASGAVDGTFEMRDTTQVPDGWGPERTMPAMLATLRVLHEYVPGAAVWFADGEA